MATEIHVSDFPPEDGRYVSRGWEGSVNIVEEVGSGDVYHVEHADQETEPEPAEDGESEGEASDD